MKIKIAFRSVAAIPLNSLASGHCSSARRDAVLRYCVSGRRFSGSATISPAEPSGRTTTRPSSHTRKITPRIDPPKVITLVPAANSAARQSDSIISTMAALSNTPAIKCPTADPASLLRVGGKSLNSANTISLPMSANVLPFRKRNGALLWHPRRKSNASASDVTFPRCSSQPAAHAPPASELIPCCAPPLAHAPRLKPTTDSQLRFLKKAARA